MKKTKAPKTIDTLEADDCRWPIGDPRRDGFHFCGEPKALGRPYCAHHSALSIQTRSHATTSPRANEPPRRAA